MTSVPSKATYTHQQIAERLGITQEVLRNWERNGLFTVERNARKHRVYTTEDYERLLIIRSLRSAHFSISSILRLAQMNATTNSFDIKETLNNTPSEGDAVHATDQLELNLREAIQDILLCLNIT